MVAQDPGAHTSAEVVDVGHEDIAPSGIEKALQALAIAEGGGEISMAGSVGRDAAVLSFEDLAGRSHPQGDELVVGSDPLGGETEVVVLFEMPFGAALGGEAVHQEHLNLATASLLRPLDVFELESQERAFSENLDGTLDRTAESGGHASVQDHGSEFTPGNSFSAEGLEFLGLGSPLLRESLDGLWFRSQDRALERVPGSGELPAPDTFLPGSEEIRVKAVTAEVMQVVRV